MTDMDVHGRMWTVHARPSWTWTDGRPRTVHAVRRPCYSKYNRGGFLLRKDDNTTRILSEIYEINIAQYLKTNE